MAYHVIFVSKFSIKDVIAAQNLETSHCEKGTGLTDVIIFEVHAIICDGLQCFQRPKIAGKCSILSQQVYYDDK